MATDLPHLLLTVLPFALASMVSPLTIIIVMAVLSATKRRALKAVLFAITVRDGLFGDMPVARCRRECRDNRRKSLIGNRGH